MKLEFSQQIFEIKNVQVENFLKIVQWEPSCCMRVGGWVGGWVDMLRLIVGFRDFAKPPDKENAVSYCHIVTVHLICLCVLALTGNEAGTGVRSTHVSFTWFQGTKYRYASHNDVSINDGPHIRRWSHKIII